MKVVIFLYSKFLKLLKTDANTFVSYILTLLTVYFALDRLAEMILLISKGLGISYWGPFMYTFALACPVFGFLFICESDFNKYRTSKARTSKLHFLYFFSSMFTIIVTSMLMQYTNLIGWIIVTSFKSFPYVAKVFPELFKPAFSSVVIVIPFLLISPLIDWFINSINDSPDAQRSIRDFEGLKLSSKSDATGPYTCEVVMFRSTDKKKDVKIPEAKRYEGALFVGPTGTGKTKTLIDPMFAFDLEKKYFLKEVSKQIAYNVLDLGLANLNAPYTNEYLNANFTMNMLTPISDKMGEYKKYVKKLIHYCNKDNSVIVYKDLGATLLTDNGDSLAELTKVGANYNIPVNVVDPMSLDSIGINPFSKNNPVECASIISGILKLLFVNENVETKDTYYMNFSQQAVENLAILLKVMYPGLHNGKLPTLEDMLQMLNNFNLVEDMCEKLKEDAELAEEYSLLISYFEKNFYKPPITTDGSEVLSYIGTGMEETKKYTYNITTQLDNILRHPGVKNILCNRTHNLDFAKALAEGQFSICSLIKGIIPFKALGWFFLQMYCTALYSRPGDEDSLIGNFLYIDNLVPYVHPSTTPLWVNFRRCKCGLATTIHNLSEIDGAGESYKELILANCKTKVVFGDTSPDDTAYWVKEFGTSKKWTYSLSWTPGKEDEPQTRGNTKWGENPKFSQEKIAQQGFRQVKYKTKDAKGKTERGSGETDFLAERHKQKHELKILDFEKFILSVQNNGKSSSTANDDTSTNYDPIKQDKFDADDLDKEDAISIPLEDKKKKAKEKSYQWF